ncbi:MAG: hypothetical protein ACI9UT_001069 [Flavobacteriales bacterium]|jgi:hypothetical protein
MLALRLTKLNTFNPRYFYRDNCKFPCGKLVNLTVIRPINIFTPLTCRMFITGKFDWIFTNRCLLLEPPVQSLSNDYPLFERSGQYVELVERWVWWRSKSSKPVYRATA